MPTLYRQYRPQTFADISGQPQVTDILQQAIVKNRVAHAYLFYGPRGTGKTTTARVFAKRLNCLTAQPNDPEPCTTCTLCTAAQNNAAIDIIEIDAASHRGIDDIRALRDATRLKPSQGKYKIYIIDEVHMLTGEAFAALLKTLEEPSERTIFILATTEFHKVPPTILSRCQVYRFRRATAAELEKRLQEIIAQEERVVEKEALEFIIERSDGCYRDAESLLGQILTAHEGTISEKSLSEFLGIPPRTLITTCLQSLIAGESAPSLTILDQILQGGFDPEQFLKEIIIAARDMALDLAKKNTDPGIQTRLALIIRALLQASQDLAYVPEPRLALELAILTVSNTKGSPPTPAPQTLKAMPVKTAASPATQPTTIPAEKPSPPKEKPQPLLATTGDISQIQQVWPQLIEAMKAANPVASTFLRAVEPMSIQNETVTIYAYYPIHRNFLEKPEHKQSIERHLRTFLNIDVRIRCELHEQKPNASLRTLGIPAAVGQSKQPNDTIYQTVKEIFGEALVEGK